MDDNVLLRNNDTLSGLSKSIGTCIHWLIMSVSMKARVRQGPKAKSIAVLPHGLTANKLVKDKIADILEETSPSERQNITVGEQRIAITHAVAAAWLWLHRYKRDTIIKAFE